MNTDPSWVAAIPAFLSFVAAALAAGAAIAASITAKRAYEFQIRQDRAKFRLSKLEVTLRHMQDVMVTFAEIRAACESGGTNQSRENIKDKADYLNRSITIIDSLHPRIGKMLHSWKLNKDSSGKSMSQVVHYELGFLGTKNEGDYDHFFRRKSEGLRRIQDQLFREISA